jgi:hypothetical protein
VTDYWCRKNINSKAKKEKKEKVDHSYKLCDTGFPSSTLP